MKPKQIAAVLILGYVILYPYSPFSYLTILDSGALGYLLIYLVFILLFQRVLLGRKFVAFSVGLALLVINESIPEAIRIVMFSHILIVLLSRYSKVFINNFIILNSLFILGYLFLLFFIDGQVLDKWNMNSLNTSENNPIWIRHNISKDFEYYFLLKFYVVRYANGIISSRQSFYFIEPFYYWNCIAPLLILYCKKINFFVLVNILGLFMAISYWGLLSLVVALLLQNLLSKNSLINYIKWTGILIFGILVSYKILEYLSPYRIYQVGIQLNFLLENIDMLWNSVDLEFLDRINYQYGILGLNSRFRYGVIIYLILGIAMLFRLTNRTHSKYSVAFIFAYLMGLKSPDFISPLLALTFILYQKASIYDFTRTE